MQAVEHRSAGALDVLRLEGITLLQTIVETLAEIGEPAQADKKRLQ